MIKQVNIINPKNETLELVLADPYTTGILVTDISGLAPPKSSINYQSLATGDGGLFASARTEPRNIVFSLRMVDTDAEDARVKTYEFFPVKKEITMQFISNKRRLMITGYVESHEADIFSSEESTQISVLCLDPWFYELGDVQTVFSGIKPLFEFPFSNESLDEPMIEFGEIMRDTRAFLEYKGDVDTGVYINIYFEAAAEDIWIFNEQTQEMMMINTARIAELTGKAVGVDDNIEICTVPGKKYIRLLRSNTYTNIISALERSSQWLVLRNGTNIFGFEARSGKNNLLVSFTYRTQYGGF